MSFLLSLMFSTKLEKRAEQVLPGSEGVGETGSEWGVGGRDGPNNVCTYEYMKNIKKIFK
jgi:hypothetical protein